MLPWSCHCAGAAGSTHSSGLESSYCVWDCHIIIPVTGLVDVKWGWEIKQMVLGKENSKNTVLVFKVQLSHRSLPCGKSLHILSTCETAPNCGGSKHRAVTSCRILLYNVQFLYSLMLYNTFYLKCALMQNQGGTGVKDCINICEEKRRSVLEWWIWGMT